MHTRVENSIPIVPPRTSYLAHALAPNQNAGIVALHFVAMYLELSVYNGDSLIFPYAASTLLAVISGILNRSAIKIAHVSILIFIILIVAFAAVIAAFGGNVIADEFARSFLQFIASIVSAYFIFITVILSSRRRLVTLLACLLIAIMAGSFLERFAAVRAFSDFIRGLLYPEALLYSADARDIGSYGAVRPSFLTREPSIVGIGAGLLISMIFLLWEARPLVRAVLAMTVTVICIYVMRSPTIIFFGAIVLYGIISLRPTAGARFSWVWAFVLGGGVIALSFAVLYAAGLAGVSNRAILGGGSYVIRFFGPPLVWLASLRDNALFGLGLGSFEALQSIARQAYSSNGILALFPYLKSERDGAFLITNGFWEYWIFFGLIGGTSLIIFLSRLFRTFGLIFVSFPFFASLLALQTYGGISAYRPWHMIFIFAAVAFVVQRGFTQLLQPDRS